MVIFGVSRLVSKFGKLPTVVILRRNSIMRNRASSYFFIFVVSGVSYSVARLIRLATTIILRHAMSSSGVVCFQVMVVFGGSCLLAKFKNLPPRLFYARISGIWKFSYLRVMVFRFVVCGGDVEKIATSAISRRNIVMLEVVLFSNFGRIRWVVVGGEVGKLPPTRLFYTAIL